MARQVEKLDLGLGFYITRPNCCCFAFKQCNQYPASIFTSISCKFSGNYFRGLIELFRKSLELEFEFEIRQNLAKLE